MIAPMVALVAWVPIGLYCFWRYPVRKALLINYLGGWALLPGAAYRPIPPQFEYWILPVSLPAGYLVTKATILSFTALAGVILSDRHFYLRFRLAFWDLPILVWCVVPFLSGVANAEPLPLTFAATFYQALAWGVPYFAGRLYFSETESLRLAARAFVIAGFAYVPICLVEIFAGPQFYARLYGFEPYRWAGAARYLGYRPIGFLEDGTQLGIWMATSALIAVWLWRRRSVERVLGIPIGVAAAVLLAVTFLCQSGASIVLLVVLLPFVFLSQRYLPRAMGGLVILGILLFAGLRVGNFFSFERLDRQYATVHDTASFLKRIKRGSFDWRMKQDDVHLGAALERPVLGSAAWDWWRGEPARPWGLWLLAFGMYGAVGLAALECVELLPVVRVIWYPLARSDIQAFNLRHALAAAILMSAVNALVNSSMILPLMVVIGGVSTWESASKAVQVGVEEEPAAS